MNVFQGLGGLSEAHEHDFPPLDESVHPSSMPDVNQLTESVVPGNSELYQKYGFAVISQKENYLYTKSIFFLRYTMDHEMKPDHPLIVKQFTRGQFHYIAVIDPVTNKVFHTVLQT